jgi:hypothetical protein
MPMPVHQGLLWIDTTTISKEEKISYIRLAQQLTGNKKTCDVLNSLRTACARMLFSMSNFTFRPLPSFFWQKEWHPSTYQPLTHWVLWNSAHIDASAPIRAEEEGLPKNWNHAGVNLTVPHAFLQNKMQGIFILGLIQCWDFDKCHVLASNATLFWSLSTVILNLNVFPDTTQHVD